MTFKRLLWCPKERKRCTEAGQFTCLVSGESWADITVCPETVASAEVSSHGKMPEVS